jgi:SAM-dependent methyltransferase
MDHSGPFVLLPDNDLTYEERAARAHKLDVRERFATIDRTIPDAYAAFATFLNLGYVANENRQFAVRGPARPLLNPFSTKLLFEVLGDAVLDGRVVLDLGAGRGGNVEMIQRYYEPSVIIGVDLSATNIAFCSTNHRLSRGGFVVGDVEHLPLGNGVADVVLNLESSHYYPHIERFFEEVARALKPGGEFLYADILPARTFEQVQQRVADVGFEILRNQDISANVLLSCEAIAKLRANPRHAALYETFTVVPGSSLFDDLRDGRTRYKMVTARRL